MTNIFDDPVLMKIGFDSFVGFCSGYILKKTGKTIAIWASVGLIGTQVAQRKGWIEPIDWSEFNCDWKIDTVDFKTRIHEVQNHLGVGISSVGGLGAGFIIGLCMG